MSRHLRFVRALALSSGAIALGCDGGALFAPRDAQSDAPGDAPDATSIDATVDGGDDADAVASRGQCRVVSFDAAGDLTCDAGGACSLAHDADSPSCTFGIDAAGEGGNAECGPITCADHCYCVGPDKGVCGCFHGSTGPLSPPDLPRYTTGAPHGRSLPEIRPRARARIRRGPRRLRRRRDLASVR